MAAQTMCPHCFKRYSVQPDFVGKSVACKGCGQTFVIEDLSGPGAAPIRGPDLQTRSKDRVRSDRERGDTISRTDFAAH